MNNRPERTWRAAPWLGGGLLVLVAALLYLAFGRVERIPGLILYPDVGRGHDDDVILPSGDRPPVGGVHHNAWLNCGIYDRPVEAGQAIHSLEHGAVWITYRPDLEAAQVERLREQVRGEAYLILSPYPGQQSPIVLTAWAVQLEVPDAEDERIEPFLAQYVLGPTVPEPGASCSSGAGEPLL